MDLNIIGTLRLKFGPCNQQADRTAIGYPADVQSERSKQQRQHVRPALFEAVTLTYLLPHWEIKARGGFYFQAALYL